MALLVGALLEWGKFYTVEGDWFEVVWLNLGPARVAFASEQYEFGDYFQQFYHGHFALWYHLEKFLNPKMGRASLWLSLATIPAWELFEEFGLRSAPVSLNDMAWAALEVFLANAQASGAMEGWGFRFSWLPLEGAHWDTSLAYADLPANSQLYYTLWALAPGNFNPWVFGIRRRCQTWEIEMGFSGGDPRNELRPEEPLLGWGCFRLDEEGFGLGTERLFVHPQTLPPGTPSLTCGSN